MAISVALLVGDVADKIMPKLAERAKQLKIKNGAWSPTRKWARSSRARHWSVTKVTSRWVSKKARSSSSMVAAMRDSGS
ncbi:MAG: hypothetical protein CBHOC_3038 [uncultured Caballeronia sp.]|nr:MAG: hypothetical protein CBHOC_3038 [uncultured Caballeronia sp.]